MMDRFTKKQSYSSAGAGSNAAMAVPFQSTLPQKSGWPSLGALAALPLRFLLQRIVRDGSLTIIAPDGHPHLFGQGAPAVTVRITGWNILWRICLNPHLALGEAYMDGTLVVEHRDIYALLEMCLANRSRHGDHWLQRAGTHFGRLWRRVAQHNPVSRARANVAHHYDLSDTLYDLFLDQGRQYSCGYFRSPTDTLECAQEQKKRHIAAKLLLSPGQRVLDIGSGWGGLALHLARSAGVDVTGVTLSTEQHAYSQRQVNEAGLTDRVRFLLKDYRHEKGKYDRIVSVGMFEHVGIGHYREYFNKVRDLLTDDGVAMIHTIGATDGPGAGHPWIAKYIFPGGYSPALSEVLPAIENAGLCVTDIEVLRLHYAETLKAWRQRFTAQWGRVATLYDERFCRMWEFYLAGCEAAFRHNSLVVFQIQLSKRNDTVPLTRDYIASAECL